MIKTTKSFSEEYFKKNFPEKFNIINLKVKEKGYDLNNFKFDHFVIEDNQYFAYYTQKINEVEYNEMYCSMYFEDNVADEMCIFQKHYKDKEEEIYRGVIFTERYPEIYDLIKEHFKKSNVDLNNYYFGQFIISDNILDLVYNHKTEEDTIYCLECTNGEEKKAKLNDGYEFIRG